MGAIRVAIVGYGNIGRGVHRALERNPDTELAGILTRGPERVKNELDERGADGTVIADASRELDFAAQYPADVAVLCGGSKEDLPQQGPKFAHHYNVVDSFDTHADIPDYFDTMDEIARSSETVAVVSTGWDPGTFSEERVKADAFLPGAQHYTFWGPGVSQGHSDAARQVEGVRDARQYTLPIEEIIDRVRSGDQPDLPAEQRHTRLVYVVAEKGADHETIARKIKEMPHYFEPYETEVRFISAEEMERDHGEMPHGGFVMAAGQTDGDNDALIEYRCEWDSNPEATAHILVAHARAAHRINERGGTGARTILQIPAVDLSPHSHEDLLREYM